MVDCLLVRYLPDKAALTQAQKQAVKQYVAGYLKDSITGKPRTPSALAGEVERPAGYSHMNLPGLAVDRRELARIKVAEASAACLVTDITGEVRSRMHKLIVDAERDRIRTGGGSIATPRLQQALADEFGELNRDWRRIAVTETAIIASEGFLASQSAGTRVKWLAHPGACLYCKTMNGRIFTVVAPDAPNKNPETQVWVGEVVENRGRRLGPFKRLPGGRLRPRTPEEHMMPAIPLHEHCKCNWVWDLSHIPMTPEQREILRQAGIDNL
jgi:hypothetical protein